MIDVYPVFIFSGLDHVVNLDNSLRSIWSKVISQCLQGRGMMMNVHPLLCNNEIINTIFNLL